MFVNVDEPDTVSDPVTTRLPDIMALPVYGNVGVLGAYEADRAWVAYDAVPNREPVTPLVTFNEYNEASEPDVMTFFQDGISFSFCVAVGYIH